MTILKKKRGIAVIVSAIIAIVLCVVGIFSATRNVLLASGEVFDYSKAEKVVRYKDYQSDPVDSAARKGLLLYAYDNGASVPFKTSFTGDFVAELTSAANEEGSVELKQYSLSVIAAVTFVICMAGLMLGKKFGTKLSGKATLFGGIILILIGLEIFITSFF